MALITLSQDFGAGGRYIANKVVKELGLTLYDDDSLMEVAREMEFEAGDLKGLKEKSPSFFERLMGKDPDIYMDVLQGVVYHIARQGTGLIFGHGSQILLKDFSCALHVRVYASPEERVRNVIKRRKVDQAQAEKVIRVKDDELKGFFKFAYHMDYNDPTLYDIVLNTEKISFSQAAKQIIALARSEEIKACSLTALDIMNRRSLERTIHARLVKQGIPLKTVFITVKDGDVAHVNGLVLNREERNNIIDIAKNTPEIAEVVDHLLIQSDVAL